MLILFMKNYGKNTNKEMNKYRISNVVISSDMIIDNDLTKKLRR